MEVDPAWFSGYKYRPDCVIRWIVIYAVESAIHISNNWGQMRNH